MSDLTKLRSGSIRIISNRRARTLRKKGVSVWYSVELLSMVRNGIDKELAQ